MFTLLLLLAPLALAWRPAPGLVFNLTDPYLQTCGLQNVCVQENVLRIPLERQLPVKSRQGWSSGYGEDECDFEPFYQVLAT